MVKVVTSARYESGIELLYGERTSQRKGCYTSEVRVRTKVVTRQSYESQPLLLHKESTSHGQSCYISDVRVTY